MLKMQTAAMPARHTVRNFKTNIGISRQPTLNQVQNPYKQKCFVNNE